MDEEPNYDGLFTKKEKRIINYILDFLTSAIMANLENNSIYTINAHRRSINDKLGVNNGEGVRNKIKKKF